MFAEHVGTIMLTQVNTGRDPWHVLAPIKIPPWTLTSARFAAIKAAGAIDTAGCSLHVQERFCNIFLIGMKIGRNLR